MEKLTESVPFVKGKLYNGELVSCVDERLPKRYRDYRVYERQIWKCIGRSSDGRTVKFQIVASCFPDNKNWFIGREMTCRVEKWYDGLGHYEEVVGHESGRYGYSAMSRFPATNDDIKYARYTEANRSVILEYDSVDGTWTAYNEEDASMERYGLRTLEAAKRWCRRNGFRVASVESGD